MSSLREQLRTISLPRMPNMPTRRITQAELKKRAMGTGLVADVEFWCSNGVWYGRMRWHGGAEITTGHPQDCKMRELLSAALDGLTGGEHAVHP